MNTAISALAFALALAVSAAVAAPVPAPFPGEPVACLDPESLWTLLDAVERGDAPTAAKLMAHGCASLAGAPYVLVEQRNGVAKVRLFRKPGDWATSQILYTLDDMIDPHAAPVDEPPRIPTGAAPRIAATTTG